MPNSDPLIEKAKAKERKRRHREKLHVMRYGPHAGSQRGKHGNHAIGENHARWNNSKRRTTSHGYMVVRVDKNHPHAWGPKALKRFKYAYEHVIVMMTHLGRPLAVDEVVHHRNGNKTDNRLENLQIMTPEEHQRYHVNETRRRDSLGRLAS